MNAIGRTTLLVAVLAAAPAAALGQTTTTEREVAVRPGTRLELHNAFGSVTIEGWARDVVRVVATHPTDITVEIESAGSVLVLRPNRHDRQIHGRRPIEWTVSVPRATDLEIHGFESPVTARGVQGAVEIHTLSGAVEVQGGRRRVEIHSVSGRVSLSGAEGDVEIHATNNPVSLRDVDGTVAVHAVNGRIDLAGIRSSRVEANTVNGKISYDGTIRSGGSYQLATHNGGIDITVPSDASASVQVVTHNGTLRSHFPIELREAQAGKEFTFTLGTGSARVELSTFNGRVELRHPE